MPPFVYVFLCGHFKLKLLDLSKLNLVCAQTQEIWNIHRGTDIFMMANKHGNIQLEVSWNDKIEDSHIYSPRHVVGSDMQWKARRGFFGWKQMLKRFLVRFTYENCRPECSLSTARLNLIFIFGLKRPKGFEHKFLCNFETGMEN